MENRRGRKLWKPPSVEDFNLNSYCKRIKLDSTELKEFNEELGALTIGEPKRVDELATHPKKIEEIKNWFKSVGLFKGSILLITGPAGSAKTITLKVVASSLNISIREWVNPADKIDFNNEFTVVDKSDFTESRQIDKFEDFIFRASRYKSLFDDNGTMVILVEDFPNIFIWKPKIFHEFLERYRTHGVSPIVFMCTDDQNLNLQNDLFPSCIKAKYNITEIKFNPVNQSSLMKTLKKEVGKYADKRGVSVETLQKIAMTSGGDIRNALYNLQILLTSSKPNKGRQLTLRDKGGNRSTCVEPLSVKDNKAEFYQALGRVLYPKTIKEMGKSEAPVENEKRMFLHDVTEISNSFGDSFLMLAHENYVKTFSDLKSVTDAANVFSLCDLFRVDYDFREYTGLVAVIGLMVSNKKPRREGFKPIKRSSAPSYGSNDIWAKRYEYSNFNATFRTLNLDYIPYLKIFEKCKGSKNNESVQLPAGESAIENDIEIEDFDD